MAFGISAATWAMAAAGTMAAGSLMQGEMQKDASDYNAAVARQNAVIAQQQGEAAAQVQNRDAQRKMGSMVAAYGASGVQSDSGSPVDALADSARMAALDHLTILYDADLRSRGLKSQSVLEDYKGEAVRTSALLNAVGSGMRGVGMTQGMGSGSVDTTDINGWR